MVKKIIVISRFAHDRKRACKNLVEKFGYSPCQIIDWDGNSHKIKGLSNCYYFDVYPLPDNWEQMEIELKIGDHTRLTDEIDKLTHKEG